MNEDVNTIEQPGEFDALPKLRPGEPYFALIGRDKLAPPLVEEWADKNRRRALADAEAGDIDPAKLADELRQSTQAEMLAAAMRAFKKGQPVDTPPTTTQRDEGHAGYTGHRLPPETAEQDRRTAARIKAASLIHNAVAALVEAAGLTRSIEQDYVARQLDGQAEFAKELAGRLQPPRKGIDA